MAENRIVNWGEALGDSSCPYCYRWVLNLALFALRIHKWVGNDDNRALHDHPYWFITFVLKGGYIDITAKGDEVVRAPAVRFRSAKHSHTIKLLTKPTWTFLITGTPWRSWGFWINGKFMRREAYFKKFGKHQCEQ